MIDFFKFKKKRDIQNPPFEYEFLKHLNEKDYPKYLKKLFEYNMGYKLNLKNPKTFNEKIQYLKLYDATELKTKLTDKVLVRDWVKLKIGEDYLKPALCICNKFNEINFDDLPNSFIIKANHGCKWHFIIKDKKTFLEKPDLYNIVEENFNFWISQNFTFYGGFELQYKNIIPKIIIEPILIDDDKSFPVEIEVYCFNGVPYFYQKIKYSNPPVSCVYTRNFNKAKLCFRARYIHVWEEADNNLKLAAEMSKILSKDFVFVRVDWLVYANRIYFNEMTFTPFSGFNHFPKEDADLVLGNMIDLSTIMKGNKI